ncbi:tegument protein [Psittacid alphaherpesvirus 5]|uniref:Tegument protein UL47 n=1 Tax=Psittacid alphaherpesvirus 5 TaxID=2972693 RepID=A0A5P9JX97_9ALPH|nr:tegument protein [Psittacid alphaherpesvirus 5]QFU14624.1 tegument protein [Psittacid alphaherpesvirus 5]UOO01095.1 tegument protein [Psittacid alphaherpesvirus 5]
MAYRKKPSSSDKLTNNTPSDTDTSGSESDIEIQISSDDEDDLTSRLYWLDNVKKWTDEAKEQALIKLTTWQVFTESPDTTVSGNQAPSDNPVKSYLIWPLGERWEALPSPPKSCILLASQNITVRAVIAGAFLIRVALCQPFARASDALTLQDLRNFLADAYRRLMQNSQTLLQKYEQTQISDYNSDPDNRLWHVIFNQFTWNHIRLKTLELYPGMKLENNVDRGSLSSRFRNAMSGLTLWPTLNASLLPFQRYLNRIVLTSFDAMEAILIAAFPIDWNCNPVHNKTFSEALTLLSEYFLLNVIFGESVLASIYTLTSTMLTIMMDNSYDQIGKSTFEPRNTEWFDNGIQSIVVREFLACPLSISTACINTYATSRNVFTSEINSLNRRFHEEVSKERENVNSDTLMRVFHDTMAFMTLYLHRLATHLNVCYAILENAAITNGPDFFLRRSAVVVYDKFSELIAPLYARMSSSDFYLLLNDAMRVAGIRQEVFHSPNEVASERLYEFRPTQQALNLRSFSTYHPTIDAPILAAKIFGRRIAKPDANKKSNYTKQISRENKRKSVFSKR